MKQQLVNPSRWQLKHMRLLLYPFRWPAKSSRLLVSDVEDRSTRAHVARLAKGNVLLQAGRYQTQEQLSERAARVSTHRFIDHADG